jgi:hypothetical protein
MWNNPTYSGTGRIADLLLNAERLTDSTNLSIAQMHAVYALCRDQNWPNLHIVDNIGAGLGRGVVALTTFNVNDIICSYHGDEVSYTRQSSLFMHVATPSLSAMHFKIKVYLGRQGDRHLILRTRQGDQRMRLSDDPSLPR